MELTIRLATRTEDSHATPVIFLSKIIQEVVRLYAGYRIKQHASLLVSVGRLMIWVSALRPYSPGGMLNTFVCKCIIIKEKKNNFSLIIFIIHNGIHSFLHGLLGSLIPIDTHAFVPQRQSSIVTCLRRFASPQVSTYYHTPLVVIVTSFDSSIAIPNQFSHEYKD